MILKRHRSLAAGDSFGEDVTLDSLLARLATTRPDARAVVDPADRPVFTDGAPRRLTWAALDREVEKLSRALRSLDLGRDAVIALQMPNTVEQIVSFLAILRAGYVVTPIPLAWRQREIGQAFSRLGVKAVLTTSRSGSMRPGEVLCHAAFEAFSVRFILAYGRNVPDGVVPIEEQIDEFASEEFEKLPDRAGKPGQHLAAITWDAVAGGFVPVPRAHCDLLAAGLGYILEAGIGGADVIATTMFGTSLAGMATGLIASLLSGAPLVLHQPFSSRALAGALATEGATHVVLPGALVAGMARAGRLPTRPTRTVSAVWRTGERPSKITIASGGPILTDVITFGEIGLIAARREADGRPQPIPHGAVRLQRTTPLGRAMIETKVSNQGRLVLRGAMTPAANLPAATGAPTLNIDFDGWVDTGLPAALHDGDIRVGSVRNGVVRIGGLAFPRRATEDYLGIAATEAGTEAQFQHDPVFGEAVQTEGGAKLLASTLDMRGASPALYPRPESSSRAQVA
ncbi:AMP-binding protein [Flaviflagellibacter deserti]|jgi:hypothetical protein|uniref:AMP-binding protein n=1 Tax=Flaviflagellibacter deserti TaxID=2267266 RepID=A0ABV9Z4Z0_9HYPH